MNSSDATAAISREALAALLYETAVSPKPGLVTPISRGAHRDMDYFTFLASAAALAPWFGEFARLGLGFVGEDRARLLPSLRASGIEAERAMFAATGGVNTHKGLVFSLGLLCAAAGILAARHETLTAEACAREAAAIARGIVARDFEGIADACEPKLSVGERLYLRWGVSGIRGEAEAGFSSVLGHSLPRLRAELAAGRPLNDALVDALLVLFTVVEDTNVLGRSGMEGLALMREKATGALALGGMSTKEGKTAIGEMDRLFAARRISPGGCADLLAATYFLHRLSWAGQRG